MKWASFAPGRVFVLRLEDGDRIPDCIEAFAVEQGIRQALVSLVGGIGSGALVEGPGFPPEGGVRPLVRTLSGVHEAAGVGTLAPNEAGKPVLHLHVAVGRDGSARVGCARTGIEVWTIGEAVLQELVGGELVRRKDPDTGFELLEVEAQRHAGK